MIREFDKLNLIIKGQKETLNFELNQNNKTNRGR